MKRRTRRVALATFTVLGMAAFACTFPDVTFAPEGVGEGGAGEGGPGASDGGGATDAPPSFFADAFSDLEAGVVKDDAGKVDAAGCTTCDCDGDQSNHNDAGCTTGGSVPDCDDTDRRAKPGMDWREDPEEAPLNGNWNCENGVEKQVPIKFDCTKVDLNSCVNAQGFAGDPKCGAEADLLACKIVTTGIFPLQSTTCQPDPTRTTKRKQACK